MVLAEDSDLNCLQPYSGLNLRIGKDTLTIHGKTPKNPHSLPLYNILWAETSETHLKIEYAATPSKSVVKPAHLEFPLDGITSKTVAAQWSSQLMKASYKDALPGKRLKILINPYGGRKIAEDLYRNQCEPLFKAAHCNLDVELTTHHKHAVEIAEMIDIDAFDAVVCVSGDGLPHEIFNGFAKRKDARQAFRKIAVCCLPGGSGNGMCLSLTGTDSASLASLVYIKGVRTSLDLISVTQGDKRTLSHLSQSFGIVADSDLGTNHLRWMGGLRFTWGLLTKIWSRAEYPCDVAFKVVMDDKEAIRQYYRRSCNGAKVETTNSKDEVDDGENEGLPPLKYGDISSPIPEDWIAESCPTMGNFFCGNMPRVSAEANFFPAALPSEGMMDSVCVDSKIPRSVAFKSLVAALDGSHFNIDVIKYRKVVAYRLIPHQQDGKTGYISIDGEAFDFAPFQAETHKGLGTVFTKDRKFSGAGV